MIFIIPTTLLVNSSIVGLMIFTSAMFLSWEIRNQIVVAIYYNFVFAAAILLNDQGIYFLPNMLESVIFAVFLSLVSIVACAVNFRTRLVLAERNLEVEKSEYKYRSIIDNSVEGIFQSTLDGKWITINKALTKILGYEDETELMNVDVRDVYDDEQDRKNLLAKLEKNEIIENYRIKLKRKDGSTAIVRLNDRLVKGENGKDYLEGNIYDITDQVKAEEERQLVESMLKEEKEKTEKLALEAIRISGSKSKFLANMSHEIRTPMNGILGFLTLIEAEAYENKEELKQFSSSARQSAESLLDIINSILDLSKIEAGKVEVERVGFNLLNVIDQSLSVVSAKAAEKKVIIIKDILEGTKVELIGDVIKLRQILINLLSNAVKFTTEGEIRIKVQTKTILNNEVELHFSVIDTGIGIPASKIKDLFKPYSQIDGYEHSYTGGTGLGLVICKEYVDLLGGNINVFSRQGEGSSFNFMIRCGVQTEVNSSNAVGNKNINARESNLFVGSSEFKNNGFKKKREKFKVLLAEDNLINQKVTIKILSTYGYNTKAVKNGKEAVDALIEGDYDLVLMDLQMPEVDGLKATKLIRSLASAKKDIPIIALTAHALMGDKEKCLVAGMTDYVSKPIVTQDLVKKIDSLLNIQSDDSAPSDISKWEENFLFDKNRLNEVSLGDYEFAKDLLNSYLVDLDKKFENLNNLLDKKDLEKIINLAHSIKGASYSIGATKVGNEAFAIELSGKNNDWLNIIERIEKLGVALDETRLEIESYSVEK
jgi:PAS domain S-box-containing protein